MILQRSTDSIFDLLNWERIMKDGMKGNENEEKLCAITECNFSENRITIGNLLDFLNANDYSVQIFF